MATIAATESADPATNVAKAVRSVALRILIFYVCSVLLIIAIVPWNSLIPGLSPFKAALDAIGIPGSSRAMSLLVIAAILSLMNTQIYIASRMLYELGKTGGGPRVLQRTASNKTPIIGVLACFVSGSAAALGQLFMGRDIFTLLASSAGGIVLFIYILIAIAQIGQRRQLERTGQALSVKMWLFPWLSYAVIVALGSVAFLLALVPEQRPPLLLSAITIAVVFAALWLHRLTRRRPADRTVPDTDTSSK